MNKFEILTIVLIVAVIALLLINYFLHGRKLSKKQKADKKPKAKVEETKKEPVVEEQKPVPVGIIKKDKIKPAENDLAPFKEEIKSEEKIEKQEKVFQDEFKSLSKDMKKIIMSDILKPRF